ncbi:hypothetical protein [Anaerosacchariphilus polymeriproducens]|uniref:DUF2975 domain-containing protein n=1 Tax=Anaerosacchariphilus polymeriproducens TaxID=1812858 RepID=A0A371ARQ8_9FIRM|nr:hypothetical protein [Anaerosacchariphilus polymeriproducens]RDU22246.1 hypothetical protein DWV06_17140 [Anaerosacchariphilus polymeriproducens]
MKKSLLFCLIITISIIDIFCLKNAFEFSVNNIVLDSSENNVALIVIIPMIIAFVIFIVTILNLLSGITGLFYLREVELHLKDFLYKKKNNFLTKLIKIVGYGFISIYFILLDDSIRNRNYYGIVFSLLAICITILYVIWFTGIINGYHIKQENRTLIDIEY